MYISLGMLVVLVWFVESLLRIAASTARSECEDDDDDDEEYYELLRKEREQYKDPRNN